MTESKKGKDDLEDLDWGSAIAEWEENTFEPEPARDKQTNRPGSLAGGAGPEPTGPGAKPLYRPSTPPPPAGPGPKAPGPRAPVAGAPRPAGSGPGGSGPGGSGPGASVPGASASKGPTPPAPPRPEHKTSPALEGLPSFDDEDDDEDAGNRTVVARIPRELLFGARGEATPNKAGGAGGGLGQLFGGGRKPTASEDGIDVILDDLIDTDTPPPAGGIPTPSQPMKQALPAAATPMKETSRPPAPTAPPTPMPAAAGADDDDAVVTSATLNDDEMSALGGLLDELATEPTSSGVHAPSSGAMPTAMPPRVEPPSSGAIPTAAPPRDAEARGGAPGRPGPGGLSPLDALSPAIPAPAPVPRALGVPAPAPSRPGEARSGEAPRAAAPKVAPPMRRPGQGAVDIFSENEVGTAPGRAGMETPAAGVPVAGASSSDVTAADADDGTVSSLGRPPSEADRRRQSSVPPLALGPALLTPDERRFDPNEETGVIPAHVIRDAIASASGPEQALEPASADAGEVPTDLRKQAELRIPITTKTGYAWENERPAAAWLDTAMVEALTERVTWLEDEARRETDRAQMARRLLTVSELRAMLGDAEAAVALAAEARDLAPAVALTHRQARGLMPMPRQARDVVAALDLESKLTTPAGKAHCALLAADALRIDGDDEGAMKRWEQAGRALPSDVRGPLSRAARALARGDLSHAALRVAEQGELETVGKALATLLRLRGVDRKGAGADAAVAANEAFLKVRTALDKGDGPRAASLLEPLRGVPELAGAAAWLAAVLAAPRAASRPDTLALLGPLARSGDVDAMRAFAARALELGSREALEEASRFEGLKPAERALLAAFAAEDGAPSEADLDAAAADEALRPLAAALSGLVRSVPEGAGSEGSSSELTREVARRHGERVAGSPEARARSRMGRLLGVSPQASDIESAAEALAPFDAHLAEALLLELAAAGGRAGDVADRLLHWPHARGDEGPDDRDRSLAASLVAERGGLAGKALVTLRDAVAADPRHRSLRRALTTLDPTLSWPAELTSLAEALGDGEEAALARIEAMTRAGEGPGPEALAALDAVHAAAPGLGVAPILGELVARRTHDAGALALWLDEHAHLAVGDAALRGAVAVAASDAGQNEVGGESVDGLLLEAVEARPGDGALLERLERVAALPPKDRARLRVDLARATEGPPRALRLLEAALFEELSGDADAALRLAEVAAEHAPSARAQRERLELATGNVARLADELLAQAKTEESPELRREAFVRLAEVDRVGRQDPASALLWHRTVLEEKPTALPSLRYVEHALIGDGRTAELETVAVTLAEQLRGTDPPEATAHAELAIRLRLRGATGDWEATRPLAELAGSLPKATIAALRLRQAHARARGDDAVYLAVTEELLARAPRPTEEAALALRAGEAAARLGDLAKATELLGRATQADPADVVTWGMLADVRQRAGDMRGAAEACESLARASTVRDHKLLAFYDAGRMWIDEVSDLDRGIAAFEEVAALDIRFQDTFARLSAVYTQKGAAAELARLLERQLDLLEDTDERVDVQVERARMLLRVGDRTSARVCLEAALEDRPEHIAALASFADLANLQQDWTAAEQAWIRLAVLVQSPSEQRDIYLRLGELYAGPLANMERAEIAFREVLKRTPDDTATMDRLVAIYQKLGDTHRAVDMLGEIVARAPNPTERRNRVHQIAALLEAAGDLRRAEQALDHARKELPNDVLALRALAEFYVRHNQRPAVQILLDRAASDTRRAFAAGRFSPALFEMLGTCFELRGKRDAANVVSATLAAFEGRPPHIRGCEAKAADKRLDDVLASELLSPAFRALLARTGEALDTASPFDARSVGAAPLPAGHKLGSFVTQTALAFGLQGIQVLVSPRLGMGIVPIGSSPPMLVVGEGLVQAKNELAREFLLMRTLKLIQARASAFVRTLPSEVPLLVAAWLKVFHPTWTPAGLPAQPLAEMSRRIGAAVSKADDPELGFMALEVVGAVGSQLQAVTPALVAWANRVGLLAVGDPGAALDGLAWLEGKDSAPASASDRGAWITRNTEAKELLLFGVTDAYGDARARTGVAVAPGPSVSMPDIPAPPPALRR